MCIITEETNTYYDKFSIKRLINCKKTTFYRFVRLILWSKEFADNEINYDSMNNFECKNFENERATSNIIKLTSIEIAEIQYDNTVDKLFINNIVLHDKLKSLSITSRQHIQFKYFKKLWIIESLNLTSEIIVNDICI